MFELPEISNYVNPGSCDPLPPPPAQISGGHSVSLAAALCSGKLRGLCFCLKSTTNNACKESCRFLALFHKLTTWLEFSF